MTSALHGPLGRIDLGDAVFTIGRAADNQLVLDDLQVSAYHAEIRPEGRGYHLTDLGSRNGTFVNDFRLTPNVPRSLHPHERIRFGQNTSSPKTVFTYEIQDVTPVEPTYEAPPVPRIDKPAMQQRPPTPAAPVPSPPQNKSGSPARSRPAIRNIIAGQTDYKPSSGMSEKELADLLAPLTSLSGGALLVSMKAGAALGKAMGFKVTNRLQKVFPGPYEYPAIVLAFVLTFRHTEREIISLYDTARGSVIEGKLATDLFSLGGLVTVEIIDESPGRILVDATAEIKGQMVDWGKSKRALEEIFATGEQYVRRITGY